VRGEGLLAAVEFVRDPDDRVVPFDAGAQGGPEGSPRRSPSSGVIGRAMPQGDILGFAPPLCLTRDEADIIVAAARGAIESVAAGLPRQG
jgi:L-2,4-diaminobutyrate transaminase